MHNHFLSNSRLLILPLIFSGLVGCQEENQPVNTVATTPTESVKSSDPTLSSSTPDPILLPIEGTVISMNDSQLVVRNSHGQELTINPTSMTLVDAGLETGDMAEIRFGQDQQPIAIRKIRGAGSEELSQSSTLPGTTKGLLTGIEKQGGAYLVRSDAGQEKPFLTNSDTLIDESIQIGDQVEVSTSAGNQAIAIRKVRAGMD